MKKKDEEKENGWSIKTSSVKVNNNKEYIYKINKLINKYMHGSVNEDSYLSPMNTSDLHQWVCARVCSTWWVSEWASEWVSGCCGCVVMTTIITSIITTIITSNVQDGRLGPVKNERNQSRGKKQLNEKKVTFPLQCRRPTIRMGPDNHTSLLLFPSNPLPHQHTHIHKLSPRKPRDPSLRRYLTRTEKKKKADLDWPPLSTLQHIHGNTRWMQGRYGVRCTVLAGP